MKQKTITTGNATVLLVELSNDIEVQKFHTENKDWQLLSRADEVTKCHELVISVIGRTSYFNRDRMISDFLESWNSLLRANEVYWENPYGEEPPSASEMFDGVSNIDHADNYQEWFESQKKVWNKSRTHIFIKQD